MTSHLTKMNSTASHSRNVDNNAFHGNTTLHQGDIHNVFNYARGRRETPPRPFPLIPFNRDPDFVSRRDILDQISARCLDPAGRVALVGLGGVGKSQLAIEFAYRFAEEHSDVRLFWIHAATQARVEEGFKLIADAIRLPERKQHKADIPLLVRKWLSIEHNGRWVIILDSADESEVLYSANENGHGKRSLAAYIPKSRNGSVLVTTRNRSLASKLTGGYKNIIEVDPMTEADALALLEKKMGSTTDIGLAKDLVKTLDYIPLAISQAAAYIQARKPRNDAGEYSNSESEADDDSDSDINGRFEEDILILRNYCLITVNEEGDKFEMHRLVQLSIKGWLKAVGLQETILHGWQRHSQQQNMRTGLFVGTSSHTFRSPLITVRTWIP
ncbi:hypothetical protein N5P37_004588 [Trichoderma harzianum]|nr:hypothetical protein N5P37_004588 [Trichoderma harzianum]